jgi:hypothetical protein
MIMKKIIILLAVALSLNVMAQNAVGDWMIHTSFAGDAVATVIETRQFVYYQSGANLFRLDKSTGENEALSKINELSDMGISNVYYNYDKDYVVVVYSNSNIDVIRSNGTVVNMPEIKDAVLTLGRTINDVTFAPGLMYLATDFGYVVIDDSKMIVKESHQYGEPLMSVAQVGNLLLLSSVSKIYYGDAGKYYENLIAFKQGDLSGNCRFWPINDNTFYNINDSTEIVTIELDEEEVAIFSSNKLLEHEATVIQHTYEGILLNVPDDSTCYKAGKDGLNLQAVCSNGELCSANPDGDGEYWAAGSRGLHLLELENYYLPNALSFDSPFWMTYNQEQDKLYVSTTAANGICNTSSPTAVNTYDGVKWTDVTPKDVPLKGNSQDGSFWLEFLPGSPNTYLMGTWFFGLLKVVDNEIVMAYDLSNSPMAKKWTIHPVTSIDRYGNVWVVQPHENEAHPVMVLPAAKVKSNETTAADWVLPSIDDTFQPDQNASTYCSRFISTRYSNYDIKLFTDGSFESPIVIWNSGGEIPSRPDQVSFKRLFDQDGLIFSWTNIKCLTEDLNGMVWMGTSEGICMFNPGHAFSGSGFSVIRPKVPRNDGTGLADRLMDGIQVNDVAVDGANRKWIATQTSGLFLVNSDGSQIIRRFNTTNSPLASNTVYKVCCNPNSNSVYVTTPDGLYEYFSDSSPAEPTYNDIYAYPNPVRPDFGGDVTIMGLMDNSLVKIADASGNVLAQMKSTGGMVTWDCCDQHGNPVKSGVYLVLCSQANGSGEAVVTKIAVIK